MVHPLHHRPVKRHRFPHRRPPHGRTHPAVRALLLRTAAKPREQHDQEHHQPSSKICANVRRCKPPPLGLSPHHGGLGASPTSPPCGQLRRNWHTPKIMFATAVASPVFVAKGLAPLKVRQPPLPGQCGVSSCGGEPLGIAWAFPPLTPGQQRLVERAPNVRGARFAGGVWGCARTRPGVSPLGHHFGIYWAIGHCGGLLTSAAREREHVGLCD